MNASTDLFGNIIQPERKKRSGRLREVFLEPPFTVLDSKTPSWQERKKKWKNLGISSEKGRKKGLTYNDCKMMQEHGGSTSTFDPVVCELIYRWFCKDNGKILDPFAGGSVRGIVAAYLGYSYVGHELSQHQVLANRIQAESIELDKNPIWIIGDSNKTLNKTPFEDYDLIFSCPPYAFLEKYSDHPDDLSNMDYGSFLEIYEQIILKSCSKLKNGGFACFVVGEVRDREGNYIGFVPDTIRAFKKAGLSFYNEAILLTSFASAPARAENNMKSKKLVKVHQNVLIFKK
jgi:DNA modification methylase